MKISHFFLLLSFLVLTTSCALQRNKPLTTVQAVPEDHSSQGYDFPNGIYYTYQFQENALTEFDVNELIQKLIKEDIQLTDLWYKAGSRSCLPPGSIMAMQLIVEPVLLVRLEKDNKKLNQLGFKSTTLTDMGACAYRVKRYRF